MKRGQSHVVGVALMLAVTVVALGTITAGIGAVFDAHAANADAQRVADDLAAAIQPVETTGPRVGAVSFSDGRLETVSRDLRVVRDGSLVANVPVDALVFTAGDHRVAAVSGAIVRGRPGGAWLRRDPPIVGSPGEGVLAIGAATLNASDVSVSGTGRTQLETDVTHARAMLGRGEYEIQLETSTPEAFVTFFEEANASVAQRDVDGDGVPSVIATYPGNRTAYLVVHDMRLEVTDG